MQANIVGNFCIGLLIVYAKSKFDNLPAEFFAQLKEEFNHAYNDLIAK
ncbi:MAG: hypothetical protein Q7T88_06985 [Methylotenera sp.]|nr:hypothetical protein [Methylotenera sp.]